MNLEQTTPEAKQLTEAFTELENANSPDQFNALVDCFGISWAKQYYKSLHDRMRLALTPKPKQENIPLKCECKFPEPYSIEYCAICGGERNSL